MKNDDQIKKIVAFENLFDEISTCHKLSVAKVGDTVKIAISNVDRGHADLLLWLLLS